MGKPNSNVAAFSCGAGGAGLRSTYTYNCEMLSFAPIDTSRATKVSRVCVLNSAGIAINPFRVIDVSTGRVIAEHRGNLDLDHRACVDLETNGNAKAGSMYKVMITQSWNGRVVQGDRLIQYEPNSLPVMYVCTGTAGRGRWRCDVPISNFDASNASVAGRGTVLAEGSTQVV